MIGASNFSSLRDAITFAIKKELFQITSNTKICSFCKNVGHVEDDCRKKMSQSSPKEDQARGNEFFRYSNNNNFRPNNMPNSYDLFVGGSRNFCRKYDRNTTQSPTSNSNNYTHNRGQNRSNNLPRFNNRPSTSNSHETHNQNSDRNNNGRSNNDQPGTSHTRNAPRNLRTIHELNSELESVAITEEKTQNSDSKIVPKN